MSTKQLIPIGAACRYQHEDCARAVVRRIEDEMRREKATA